MPQTHHVEKHFSGAQSVRDVVIGMSDGLTVPFALAAGLTGAVASNAIVVTAGMAEIVAGSIAMGLGGYLAGRSDAEHYASERERERLEVEHKPAAEAHEVAGILGAYGLGDEEIAPIMAKFRARPDSWIDFMMRFELGLEKPNPRRALISAFTIAGAYIAGGLVPLMPYMVLSQTRSALWLSSLSTVAALLIFGYIKGRFTGASPVRSALQTTLVGGLAAAAAFLIARAIS